MTAPYPPAPAPSPARPPLRRPRQGRVLAGVGAGLADHLGIDVAIVRVLIVVVTIVTQGLGLLAYVLGAVFIPAEAETDLQSGSASPAPSSEQPPRSGMFWAGIALLVVGVLALINGPLSSFGPSFGLTSGVLGPLVLIGFGLALWVAGDRSRPAATPPAAAATPPPATAPSFPPSTPPAAVAAAQEPPMTSDPTPRTLRPPPAPARAAPGRRNRPAIPSRVPYPRRPRRRPPPDSPLPDSPHPDSPLPDSLSPSPPPSPRCGRRRRCPGVDRLNPRPGRRPRPPNVSVHRSGRSRSVWRC